MPFHCEGLSYTVSYIVLMLTYRLHTGLLKEIILTDEYTEQERKHEARRKLRGKNSAHLLPKGTENLKTGVQLSMLSHSCFSSIFPICSDLKACLQISLLNILEEHQGFK